MAIASVADAATKLAEIKAISPSTTNASNLFNVGMGAVYEMRSVTGLSPTDSASMQNIARGLEDYLNKSVQPFVRSA
jgi:hypothetical protein